WFPLSTKEGFSQWWAGASPMATEHRVLSFIPYLQQPPTQTQTGSSHCSKSTTDLSAPPKVPEAHTTTDTLTDPYGPRRWNSEIVELSGKGRALNEFSVERTGEEVQDTLVMLHGYGAGLGFFYRNFEALSRTEGWKVYALDLLGMGRSSRPAFKIHAKDREGKITEAENWFIDALEEWRIKRGLERFTLLGHSLGGYLATAYALKYPGRLNKLILASPVGIPEDPDAVNDDMPDPQDSTMANEFTQDQDETTDGPASKTADKKPSNPPPRRRLPPWLTYLWESNMISPFSLIRWSGPLGPRLVSGWTSRRFSQLPEEEAQALHDYSYSIFRQRGSSEYALAYLLAPGAFARSPLIRRIHGVGRQWIQPHDGAVVDNDSAPEGVKREHGVPVVFMYGEHDWMDVAGGFAAQEVMRREKEKVVERRRANGETGVVKDQGDAKVVIIRKAGHHVYLDGWEQFNEVMAEEMEDVRRR
ncbi:alpha/beta-hydrolase, partial [Periconia macrospinosa]